MKYNLLFVISLLLPFITDSASAEDIRKYVDPWGNRVSAIDLRNRRKDIESQIAAARQNLAKVQADLTQSQNQTQNKKNQITALKQKISSLWLEQNQNLKQITEEQKNLVDKTKEVFNSVQVLAVKIQSIIDLGATLQTYQIALQTLNPIFENTNANRNLWVRTIDHIGQAPNISVKDLLILNKLRSEILNDDEWLWKSPKIFKQLTDNLSNLSKIVSRKLLTDLKSEVELLVANLNIELKLQESLLQQFEVATKVHEAIVR